MSGDGDRKPRGRPWPKGVSGNPGGRPRRGQALADLLRAELDKAGPDGRSRGERIARKLVELAEGGDVRAIRECYDRVLGRPGQVLRLDRVRDCPELDSGECDGICQGCVLEFVPLADRPAVEARVHKFLSPEFLDTMPELWAQLEAAAKEDEALRAKGLPVLGGRAGRRPTRQEPRRRAQETGGV
jgi:hypothetical protein